MWTFKIIGLISNPKDEKSILEGINSYLKTISRTTSIAKNKSLLDARLPFVYNYFYWNLNKETGTWFELFPNADCLENWFDPGHKDCSWIIKVIFHDDTPGYDYAKALQFIDNVMKSSGKEHKAIKEGRE